MAKKQAVYYGTGRRKNAIARVRLVPGTGRYMLDGKDDNDYFGQERLSIIIRRPFEVTGTLGKYAWWRSYWPSRCFVFRDS